MIKVFIVEDERNIREGLSMFLSNIPDLKVEGVFSDAESALAMIHDYPPSIVITDIVMKNMSGIEMIKECRKYNSECEFVILSGYNELEYARAAIKYNVAAFLEKPIDHEELQAVLDKIKKKIFYVREARRSLIINLIENNIDEPAALEQYFPGVGVRVVKINTGFAGDNTPEFNKKLKWQTLKDEEMLCRYMVVSSVRDGVVTGVLIDDLLTPKKIGKFLDLLQARTNSDVIRCGVSSCGEATELNQLNKDAELALAHSSITDTPIVFAEQLPYLKTINVESAANIADIIPYLKNLEYEAIREQMNLAIDRLADEAPPYAAYEFVLRCMQFMQSILPNCGLENRRGHIIGATSKDELKSRAFDLLRDVCESRNGAEGTDQDLERVIKYINLNYMRNDISAKLMAQKMFLNPEYFSRKFKSVTGTNYSEYITNLRISKAKELLRLRNYPISQIAEMVGYQTVRYFSKVFKKHVGMMPKEYRNGAAKDDQ